MHLLFFDGTCGLCDQAVQFVINRDRNKLFYFAPLQGLTAEQQLKDLSSQMKQVDSLILIENYQQPNQKIYIKSQGAFRICWILGGWLKIPGSLSFLPGFFFDWIYRIVAKNRHRFFKSCLLNHDDRFLP